MRPLPPKHPRQPRPRPDPDIRVSPTGVLIDGIDRYARQVTGQAPENFKELSGFVGELLPVLAEICGIDTKEERGADQIRNDSDHMRDTLLLAAWALTETANGGLGENPTAFVQRAKQVIGWCDPKTSALTLLEHLEHKNRELARMVGQRLARHEGFVLLMFDHGLDDKHPGSSTWISSVDRRQAIDLIGDLLKHMREDQAGRS
jgi:hypothetical protein